MRLWLNLKLTDSKSMYATSAACSPLAVILLVSKALLMADAARVASAHSFGATAPSHEAVSGAMTMSVFAVKAPATGTAASVVV